MVCMASCSVISGAPESPSALRTAWTSTATSMSSLSGSRDAPITRSPISRPTCSREGAGGSEPGARPGTRWPVRTAMTSCSIAWVACASSSDCSGLPPAMALARAFSMAAKSMSRAIGWNERATSRPIA